MTTKLFRNPIFLLFFLVLFIFSASAAGQLNRISQGNTIFIGENGLDVSNAMRSDSQIGWWASAASITSSAPTKTISIPDKSSFFVTASDFSGNTGNWYRINNSGVQDGIAFNVADPQLSIKAIDPVIPGDRTNDWVPTGDPVYFEIDSNLYNANQRGSGAPVTIHVQAPGGNEYSQLAGSTRSLTDVPITTNPFLSNSVGIIWNTGDPLYAQGTYTIWAECTLNGMKDNYPVTGKSISSTITILDQDVNPLIKSYTTAPTPTIVVPTTTALPMTTAIPRATTPSVVATTQTTEVTSPPVTSIVPIETTTMTVTTGIPPSPTKSPGFEIIIALAALVFVFMVYQRKN